MKRARTAVVVCTGIGLAVLALQMWAYGAWGLSSPGPVRSPGSVPSNVLHRLRVAELTSVLGAAGWLAYVGWDWIQQRRLTWPLLWTIAWASVFWQEPLVNVRNHTFSFNSEFHNLGDWTTHIPFVPGTYTPLPEALVLEGLVFLYLLPLLAISVAALLRVLRRTMPTAPVALLILIVYLCVVGFDIAFELQGVHQGLLRYVEVGGPTLNAGTPDQWPILEGFLIGAAWTIPGVVTFLLRDEWALQLDGPVWWSGTRAKAVTVLAAIGGLNLAFGAYNAAYVVVMDGTTAHEPAWVAPATPVTLDRHPRR